MEDLDDISKIKEMKNRIEELNIDDFVNKYNIKNYVFTLMHHQNNQLKIYVKINFNDSSISRNITYELNDIKNELKLNYILKDLKMQIIRYLERTERYKSFDPIINKNKISTYKSS